MFIAGRKTVHITCPSNALIASASVPLEDNRYRKMVIDEITKSKKLIDNGYVFPKPSVFSKVKKKVKSLF